MNILRTVPRPGSDGVINEPGSACFQRLLLPPKDLHRIQGNDTRKLISDCQSLNKSSASNSMKRSIILAALFAFGLLGCNRPAGSSDELRFISSTGTFKLFGGQMTVSVEETQDGVIDYSVTRGTSTAKTDPLIRKGSDWLIYAASPDAVWMHDGETNVLLIELSDKGDSKFTSIGVVPDLLQRAPPAFLDRLPPDMKK